MKRIFQTLLLAALCICSGAVAQVSTSKWQAQPIVIDGDGSDWGTLPRFFNVDSNMKYEFRNDDQNLYIILRAAERMTQTQMLAAGFYVKLKVKTSPPIKVGINFKALKKGEMPPMIVAQDGKTDKLNYKTESVDRTIPKDTALLDGFQFAKGKITSENSDDKSINFARSKTSRELATYEIRIPLREIFGNGYTMENVSSTPIQLQVSINDLSQNDIKKMTGRKGNKNMPGGMHSGGRGMGGSMGGRDMEGGGIGGSEMGEMPGQDAQNQLMEMQERGNFMLERRSFSIDFKLSSSK
ncbi:MAG: hypothetical protein PHT07_00865 [Paludibacter sp.]|nr:hypothetical protein [Paludibacter sp.]